MTQPAPRLDGTARNGVCLECGAGFVSVRAHAEFCSTPCRKAWNNRRATRGAELYDLFMALRFDRKRATLLKLWRIVARLASMFRDEDVEQRAGRRSWQDPREVLQRRPYLTATVMSRNAAGARR